MATQEKITGKCQNFQLDDIPDAYELYCDNYKEFDENLDMDVLPVGFTTIQEFESLLTEPTVYALIWETHYNTKEIKCKSLDGFVVFNLQPNDYSILMIESNQKDKDILRRLLYEIVSVANNSSVKKPVILQIPETRLDLCEEAVKVGFKLVATERNSDKPDIFKYCYKHK